MAPTVRDHSARMVDRKAAVVRVDGVVLLEVEDKTGQAHEDAKDSVGRRGRKSRVLSPMFWHIPVDVRLSGGGCRVVKIFVHKRKPEQREPKSDVQRCTHT